MSDRGWSIRVDENYIPFSKHLHEFTGHGHTTLALYNPSGVRVKSIEVQPDNSRKALFGNAKLKFRKNYERENTDVSHIIIDHLKEKDAQYIFRYASVTGTKNMVGGNYETPASILYKFDKEFARALHGDLSRDELAKLDDYTKNSNAFTSISVLAAIDEAKRKRVGQTHTLSPDAFKYDPTGWWYPYKNGYYNLDHQLVEPGYHSFAKRYPSRNARTAGDPLERGLRSNKWQGGGRSAMGYDLDYGYDPRLQFGVYEFSRRAAIEAEGGMTPPTIPYADHREPPVPAGGTGKRQFGGPVRLQRRRAVQRPSGPGVARGGLADFARKPQQPSIRQPSRAISRKPLSRAPHQQRYSGR